MSDQYGMDLRSRGGAGVAKAVLSSELKKGGVSVPRGRVVVDRVIKYTDPGFINFETPELQRIWNIVKECQFLVGENGQVKIPDALNTVISFGGSDYKFGIGGLHSQETSQNLTCEHDELLFEKDVASMYPNIILGQNLYPKHLGVDFCEVYRRIVNQRLDAKRLKDVSTSDSLKLVINSSFGLFGSKYSFLYSPNLLVQTTITGQLCLLMLIERLHGIGVSVYSANTDGLVMKCKKGEQYQTLEEVCFDWEMDVGLLLEETRYESIHSQNVNNYFAIRVDGGVSRKGCFSTGGLAKNPDRAICFDAVVENIKRGTPIEKTIKGCDDVRKFLILRQVRGGAIWGGDDLGRAVRFYYSKSDLMDSAIRYKTNGNKVPKSEGSRPIMNLPAEMPENVDYCRYIDESLKILKSVGA
jgi:hypothetical protein